MANVKAALGKRSKLVATAHMASLDPDDAGHALDHADTLDIDRGDALRLVVFTILRRQAAMAMEWSWVDFDGGTLDIPATGMKGRKAFSVPLTDSALVVLKRRKLANVSGSKFVFPSQNDPDKHRHTDDLTHAVSEDESGKDWTLHGLRTTFRVWAARQNVPEGIAEWVLAHDHKDPTVRAYLRTTYFEQRAKLMPEWEAHVLATRAV